MNESGLRRCILLPIDLHGINRNTLETVVRIASLLDRKVLGLLLEDMRLQQVADLPFTTEITLDSGREKSFLRDHLSQRHDLISGEARRLLHELAKSHQVELSFEDACGRRWPSALARDGHQDIFLPPRRRWHDRVPASGKKTYGIRRLGAVLPHGLEDEHIVATAAALVQADLVGDVYLLTRRPLLPEQLHQLYRQGHQVRLQANFSCSTQDLVTLIRQSPYDLLLLPGACLHGIAPADLDAALDKASGQILIIN